MVRDLRVVVVVLAICGGASWMASRGGEGVATVAAAACATGAVGLLAWAVLGMRRARLTGASSRRGAPDLVWGSLEADGEVRTWFTDRAVVATRDTTRRKVGSGDDRRMKTVWCHEPVAEGAAVRDLSTGRVVRLVGEGSLRADVRFQARHGTGRSPIVLEERSLEAGDEVVASGTPANAPDGVEQLVSWTLRGGTEADPGRWRLRAVVASLGAVGCAVLAAIVLVA